MVKIRLVRMGNNKKPFFRVVVSEANRKINGRYLENVGWFDPKLTKNNLKIELDRVDHWIARGAQLTDSAAALVRKQRRAKPVEAAAAT
ncbi:MAG: 30S ribosomal protein S16 [Kiritimatiellae bacterium]|nr:30S ribosomal protein S16 [Kiritimatiellia bacterium]MCO5067099.1 30S ribosomal protein S16 [Kiritimatiellia bacterium]MCO6401260.1 30S ribosomal protein S16 [Verrucomicrobiota bacterium]